MTYFSEACERNKDPILAVLRREFADSSRVLEVGSGTGQHAVYFATHLPHLEWYPTERLGSLGDLIDRIRLAHLPNLQAPSVLDVQQSVWPLSRADAIFSANTLHIMSWEEVRAFFSGIGLILPKNGVLCLYGPFRYQGRYTSPSNRQFDDMLKARDSRSGLRDLIELQSLATASGLVLRADHDLPANNQLLVFVRE